MAESGGTCADAEHSLVLFIGIDSEQFLHPTVCIFYSFIDAILSCVKTMKINRESYLLAVLNGALLD